MQESTKKEYLITEDEIKKKFKIEGNIKYFYNLKRDFKNVLIIEMGD
jgi:hypothetical protein